MRKSKLWPVLGVLPVAGLLLDPAKAMVDVLVVDHVEKPSEN